VRQGALAHLTVVEFAGLGPAPFAAMMLADHGARVIRIDRPLKLAPANSAVKADGMAALTARKSDVLSRGRESITLDLKNPAHRDIALKLIERADALIEGFRPGVMESLGLGPDICLQHNPKLVYTRATGWGQTGPLAQAAGHDINFTALSGALHSVAPSGGSPTPTPGLIGDFGGGGMFAAFGRDKDRWWTLRFRRARPCFPRSFTVGAQSACGTTKVAPTMAMAERIFITLIVAPTGNTFR
jgi:alpha-methylacyl-CoA racemase